MIHVHPILAVPIHESPLPLVSRRKLLTECCDPPRMFAVTKENSPLGKVMWYDGEFYHSHTVSNETYPLFVQVGGGRCPGGSNLGVVSFKWWDWQCKNVPLTLQMPFYFIGLHRKDMDPLMIDGDNYSFNSKWLSCHSPTQPLEIRGFEDMEEDVSQCPS